MKQPNIGAPTSAFALRTTPTTLKTASSTDTLTTASFSPTFVFGARLLCLLFVVSASAGCVARTSYDKLSTAHSALERQRNELMAEVERLTIERNSLEEQYIEAQESYEDERVVRSSLASNLSRLKKEAEDLDADLGATRIAHIEAATALAAREAELAAMQSTYDVLVQDLESEVSSGQIEIERLREGLRLNVSDDVLFASGSAQLDRIGRQVLEKVAAQVKDMKDFVEVRGHTDDRPIRGSLAKRYPTNWELAGARAARVARLLEEKGVAGERLSVVSRGPNDPIAPNETREQRALNRRIEIRLLPRKGAGAGDASALDPKTRPQPKPKPGTASPKKQRKRTVPARKLDSKAKTQQKSRPAAAAAPSEKTTGPLEGGAGG